MHPHLHTEAALGPHILPYAGETRPYSNKMALYQSTHDTKRKPKYTACEGLVAALEACHARGFMWQVFGNCSETKRRVNECLIAVRAERARQNRVKARKDRDRFHQLLVERGFRSANDFSYPAAAGDKQIDNRS